LLDEAQKALVVDNIALAKFLARVTWNKAPNTLELEDLTSLAYQGLVSAAMRWRPYGEEHGYSEESIVSGEMFSVFARRRILGQMMDSMREADHVQRSYRSDYKSLTRAGYGQDSKTEADLMQSTGLSSERIRAVVRAVEATPVSLNFTVNSSTGGDSYEKEIEADDNVESSGVVSMVQNVLGDLYDTLPIIQQVILALRYYQGLELQAIALKLEIGLTPIREQHDTALTAVYRVMREVIEEDPRV
jgi:RNA polymerase sigma factor (sigma-70 family)